MRKSNENSQETETQLRVYINLLLDFLSMAEKTFLLCETDGRMNICSFDWELD